MPPGAGLTSTKQSAGLPYVNIPSEIIAGPSRYDTSIIIGAYSMGGSLNPVPVSGVDTGLGHCPRDRGLAVKMSMVVPR